ncbi:hypothetical protein AMECASPLE_036997 [Ameca splendens]|uniref:DDE Tnp4 domain-containing protein n=1 Tax=Ameca splendens TaxID=208324 RepID=A0ABV0YIX2_9TELE
MLLEQKRAVSLLLHLVVEDSFGIWTPQWRWYHLDLEVRTEVVELFVKVTCVLHNFMRASVSDESPAVMGPAAAEVPLQGLGRVATSNSSTEARCVRDALKEFFVGEGAVPWQPTA